ncbi:MAG: L-threonylcarbamoyladenylate synthase [Bacteroidales bacterium]
MQYNITPIEIENCVKTLKNGGIILYPTDTIWGIGCDATDKNAISKIYRLKHREEDQSFIVLVSSQEQLKEYVHDIPPVAYDLMNAMDTPLTIIYPKGKNLAENVMGKDGSIAIRVVKNDFCCQLINELGKPIVSTSANISGEPSPLSFQSISKEIIKGVDHLVILSATHIEKTRASRIIKIEPSGMFTIIRE